jgi:hypothetical protein
MIQDTSAHHGARKLARTLSPNACQSVEAVSRFRNPAKPGLARTAYLGTPRPPQGGDQRGGHHLLYTGGVRGGPWSGVPVVYPLVYRYFATSRKDPRDGLP